MTVSSQADDSIDRIKASKGLATISGRADSSQWAIELAEDDDLERHRGVAVELERAVLGVGAEQAVEPEQHREEGRDPDDAGGEAGEGRAVGADGERHDRARPSTKNSTSVSTSPPRRAASFRSRAMMARKARIRRRPA